MKLRNRKLNNLKRRFSETGPYIALALLLVLPAALPDGSSVSASAAEHHEEIVEAMRAAPWQIDRWHGEPVPVPAEAQEILRPNAILSRRYRELGTGLEAILVIVHCSDTRDMLGHWPPVCYPANGWRLEDERERSFECSVGGADSVELREYDFYQNMNIGVRRDIRVFNCFILPNGEIASDFSELRQLAGRTHSSVLGVAQVQIVIAQPMSASQEQRTISELLNGIDQLILRFGKIDS